MPHSLFIGSALATQDRISFRKKALAKEKLALTPVDSKDSDSLESTSTTPARPKTRIQRWVYNARESCLNAFRKPPPSSYATVATRHADRENNPLAFVKAHIYHGIVDVVASLLGFAVLINSL